MGKLHVVMVSAAVAAALLGCSTRSDERATATSSGAVAASRPAEAPAPAPQTAAQPDQTQMNRDFRQTQRK